MPHARRSARLTLRPLEDRTAPSAGTLDPSFGDGGGVVKFNLEGHFSMNARGVAVQPDGKTVLAGLADTETRPEGAVYRLTADGTLDPSFGGGDGFVTVGFDGLVTTFYDVEIQPGGKIVATGSTGFGSDFMVLVARFLPDGTPDATFSGDGSVTTNLTPRDESGFSMALQSDGKVVVCGNILSDEDDGFLFLRYTADGALDPMFGLGGVQKYNSGGGGALGRAVAIQPDGKIVGAGYGSPVGEPGRALMLIRLNADGTFDDSFDGDGIVTTFVPGTGFAEGHDVAVLPDGRLAAVGFAEVSGEGQPVAARYLADGSLDPTFDGDGTFLLQVPPDAAGGHLTTVAADPEGRIVAAGYTAFPHDGLLMRFNEDGTPDPDFGVGNTLLQPGVVFTDAGGGEEIYDLAVFPDGRMVTAGRSDNDLVAIRYLGDTPPTAVVELDVRPGSEGNRVNLGSNGILPVAILTTPDFDAGRVDVSDLSRLQLGDAAAAARVSPVRYAYEDVDGDGDLDLMLFFSIRDLRESGALTTATTVVSLTGLLVDGTAFVGTDSVEVVGGA